MYIRRQGSTVDSRRSYMRFIIAVGSKVSEPTTLVRTCFIVNLVGAVFSRVDPGSRNERREEKANDALRTIWEICNSM